MATATATTKEHKIETALSCEKEKKNTPDVSRNHKRNGDREREGQGKNYDSI